MKKIIVAVISGLAILVGIVVINNQNAITHINQDLDSNPSAAGAGILRGGDSATNNTSGLGSGSRHSAGKGLIRVLKTVENGVTSYSDVPARQTRPQAKAQTTTATTSTRSTNTRDTTVTKTEIIKIKTNTNTNTNTNKDLYSSPVTSSSKICKNIGVNTEELVYYGSEMPLKDLAKMTAPWDADLPLDIDTNGYIKSFSINNRARTIITDDNWGRSEDDNKYVVLYDGEGKLDFIYNRPKVIKSKPGRIEIEFQKHARYGLSEVSTNPANYLRNIRIIPLQNEHDYTKTVTRKEFRDVWRGVGVMRYLNNQNTNNSTEVEWNDRQKETTFGTKHGESLEDIIRTSNEMNNSPWLLVPHLASDDYFRKMAIYVRDHLNPNLKVYIEYTNEAWNFGFQQAQYLYKLSQKNGTSRQLEYGLRAKKLFDVWSDVFGGNDRLVRVIGTQLYYPWISEQIMKTPGLAESTDALAVGYYIGHEFSGDELSKKVVNMTDDEVFDYLYNVSFPKAEKALKDQKKIADQYNLKLVAYEAGQHLLAGKKWREDTAVANRFIELNHSSKMYQLYINMYKLWNDIGGGLIVWFQTASKGSKWGNWGMLENTSQNPSDAPKYRAFRKMLSENGCL